MGAPRQRKRQPQQQRVFIFTSIADPCSSGTSSSSSSSSSSRSGTSSSSSEEKAEIERNACIQRAHDLRSEQTEIQLFPLELQDGAFDFSAFWREALGMQAGEEPYYLLLADVRAGVERAGKRPRLLSASELFLTPSLRLPICLYSSVSPPKLLKPQRLAMPSGVPIVSFQRWKAEVGGGPPAWGPPVKEDPAEGPLEEGPTEGAPEEAVKAEVGGPSFEGELNPQELTRVVEHCNKVIEMKEEEIHALKQFGPTCMRLLGFLPLSRLSLDETTAASLFVASASHALADRARRRQLRDRERGAGDLETRDARHYYAEASRMLSSLILAMDRKQVAAVVSFVPRRGAAVCLAALLPQLQEVDERGVTLQSSGLHLLRLPFKEDVRVPHIPWASAAFSPAFLSLAGAARRRQAEGIELGTSAVEQQAADALSTTERQMLQLSRQAAAILKKVEITDFDVLQIPNPTKAKQMAALEAFALRLSVPNPQPDALEFDKERFQLVDPLFLEWADRVRDAAPPPAEPLRAKRKAGGGGEDLLDGPPRAPRPRSSGAPPDEEVRALAASSKLESLTVAQLKQVLSRWRLTVGGHKAELIARVSAHLCNL
ncbi:hypothetical protein Efla_007702 [Eimeria flavescens]